MKRFVMRTQLSLVVAGVGLYAMLAAPPIAAHHAFGALYDANRPVRLSGTVAKIEFINPHAWIYLDLKKNDGKAEQWMIEAGSPASLLTRGFTRDTVKLGTEVTVDGYQSKDEIDARSWPGTDNARWPAVVHWFLRQRCSLRQPECFARQPESCAHAGVRSMVDECCSVAAVGINGRSKDEDRKNLRKPSHGHRFDHQPAQRGNATGTAPRFGTDRPKCSFHADRPRDSGSQRNGTRKRAHDIRNAGAVNPHPMAAVAPSQPHDHNSDHSDWCWTTSRPMSCQCPSTGQITKNSIG